MKQSITEEHIEELSKTYNQMRNSSNYPTGDYFRYVRGQWYKHGYLTTWETKFILDLLMMNKADLYQKAYIMGEWFDIEPKHIKYHNLKRNKLVKKCIHR